MTAPDSQAGCPLVPLLRRNFQRRRPDGSLARLFHVKAHACLQGIFRVEPPDDPALRQGLFAVPGSYPALVRFSNGLLADDRLPDARGMAIKLSGVPGPVCAGAPPGQQDFLMTDQPRTPSRDAEEALRFFTAIDGIGEITPLRLVAPSYLVPGFNPRRIRWHYAALMLDTALAHLRETLFGRDLAALTYHGVTPYRLGDGAMKFQCRPVPPIARARRRPGGGFAERLQASLDRGPLSFDFLIQPRQGEDDPLDSAGTPWQGPLIRVARLELPRQNPAAGLAAGERIAFNPWHALAAHEPLGSLNAARRAVYAASAADRGGVPSLPAEATEDHPWP